MGNRSVDNFVILSTILLRITILYCVLFDNEHKAPEEKPTWWRSVAANLFSVDNDLSLKLYGEHTSDFGFLLQSCDGLRLVVYLMVFLGCGQFLIVIGVNSYVWFNICCWKYVDLY